MYDYLNYIFTGGGTGLGLLIFYFFYKKFKKGHLNSKCTNKDFEIKINFDDVEKSSSHIVESIQQNDKLKKCVIKKIMSNKNLFELVEEYEREIKNNEGLHIGHAVEMV